MRHQTHDTPAVRAARWSATHPAKAIIGWILIVVACATAGAAIGTDQAGGPDFWVGEAGRAERIATEAGVPPPVTEQVLVTPNGGGSAGPGADAAASDVAGRLRALPAVAEVSEPRRSADGTAVLVTATLRADSQSATADLPALQEQVGLAQQAHPDSTLAQTGTASTSAGNSAQLGADLLRAETITLPVTLVILVLVFGALLVAAVPLVLALTSVVAAMGLYGLASHLFPDAGGAVANVVLLMGLAVGVDYSLFYVERVREERARADGAIGDADAVELAARTSGRAIIVSGVAVLVSLVALHLADDVIFSSIATGSIIVVLVAMISSLTVLPALLVVLGRRVDRRPLRRSRRRPGEPSVRWSALLRPATTRPVLTSVVAGGAMVLLALPALGLNLRVEGNDTFPKTVPAIATYDRMVASFPDEGVAHLVAVRADPSRSAEVRAALTELSASDPSRAPGPAPQPTTSADGSVSTLRLPIPTDVNSEPSQTSLERLRTQLLPSTVGEIPGAEYAVSGDVARSVDYPGHQGDRTPLVVGFVLLATFLTTAVAFRSVVIGVLGVVLNLLSVAAAIGALVAVFQGIAGGFVSSRIPLVVFVILFGLSMDYQVFVVSRIREGVLAGRSTPEAVSDGIRRSAGVVTSAAVVMVSVFVSFLFVGLLELKQIGFGLAVGVVLDAVLIRILILPAALTLLGERSWWPLRPGQSTARSSSSTARTRSLTSRSL